MAKRHSEGMESNDAPTDDNEDATASASRRTLLKGAGAFASVGAAGLLGSKAASAAGDFGDYSTPSGEVHIPPGEYTWNGDDLDIGSGDALVGDGDPGDVVVNLEGGTMEGWIEGRLENVVVKGRNRDDRAGLYVVEGSEIDGFVWTDGGNETKDRALYNPEGGERAVVRNSAWAWMGNNGAYTDKLPMTFENCVAANNNIANIRVGHRRGTDVGATTYVRNCLIAVTDSPRTDGGNSMNARGLRMRHPGDFVVENCHFVAMDVDGVGNPIIMHDGAEGSTVTVRNCHFYNDSGRKLVRDKTGGSCDVTVENCTFQGSGSDEIGPSYSGSGIVEGSASFPLPSEVTGRAAADDIDGIESGVGPWSESTTDTARTTYDNTMVIHASPDNPVSDAGVPGDFDMDIVVSGDGAFGEHAEPRDDSITVLDNGNTLMEVQDLAPDELDSFRFDGEVVDYVVDDGYDYSVSVNGTTTTFDELVNDGTSSGDDSTSDGQDSTATEDTTTEDTTADDSTTENTTTTDGSTTEDSVTVDDPAGDGSRTTDVAATDLPNRVVVDGGGSGSPTNYTFTVSGEVVRDTEESSRTVDGTDWDRVEDFAEDGKVIGLVGSGVDAYRFSGSITGVSVDGEASLSVERGI